MSPSKWFLLMNHPSRLLLPAIAFVLICARTLCGSVDAPVPASAGHWIVVTAPAFKDAIEPLKHRRVADGFDVVVLNTADVLTNEEVQHNQGEKLLAAVRKQWQQSPGNSYVLLVGTVIAPNKADVVATQIPILRGTIGRMKNQPTDLAYGCDEGDLIPKVPVGRFPARTVDEAKAMVAKTIAYEDDGKQAAWRRSISMLVGSPGGASAAEKAMGNWYVSSACQTTAQKINPVLQMRSIYHISSSQFYVPDDALHDQSLEMLKQGQAFVLHLGHSSPEGFWSDNATFLDRQDWKNLNMPHGAGVLVTCGCFACRLDPAGREDQEGYGLAAIRSTSGPVAVIGATAESYSVAGYTAFNGLLQSFSTDQFPKRLGESWLNIQTAIAKGPVDFFTFEMFDYGDGSNGNIPLATQRQEHLQMWMLLGDPAMRLPEIKAQITLHVGDTAKPGVTLNVLGELPKGAGIDRVHLTLERPLGSTPTDLTALPEKSGPQRDETVLSNFHKAQDFVLTGQDVAVENDKFDANVVVPTKLPWNRLVVRAVGIDDKQTMGVTQIKLQR